MVKSLIFIFPYQYSEAISCCVKTNPKNTSLTKWLVDSHLFLIYKFKVSNVWVFCVSIGGLFYIVFTIKMILQIKSHNYNFGFCCFGRITYYTFYKDHLIPWTISMHLIQKRYGFKTVSEFILILHLPASSVYGISVLFFNTIKILL